MTFLRTITYALILINLGVLTAFSKNEYAQRGPDGRKIRTAVRTNFEGVVHLESWHGLCSGFIAAPGIVVTAAHCTEEANSLTATFVDGRTSDLLLVKRGVPASGTDYSILVGPTYGLEPLELGEEPTETEGCLIVGTASYRDRLQRASPCVTTEHVDVDGRVIIGDGDYGDSGGAVLGSTGVIGILWGGRDEAIGYIVTVTELRKALNR